ncbi:hypothetical protein F511_43722 [Dorcoceras hygrometricum]|uniref:Uncharacterized protein n=1 Tax=Dorcoceras hygrometricum TaxID=472368 RepID=A0A2Z7ANK5_9LAMI|nr:hypothetical protein F511_43722 [Dorcoceras hygrometricum]
MQMDIDLVIYRTTLVRTFQVVTICRVDNCLPPLPHAPIGRRLAPPRAAAVCRRLRDRTCFDHRDEELPFMPNSSDLLVQADEGVVLLIVDLIDDLPPPTV